MAHITPKLNNRSITGFISPPNRPLRDILSPQQVLPAPKFPTAPSKDSFSPSNIATSPTTTTARKITTPVFSWVPPSELTENQQKYLNKGKFLKDQNGQMYYVGMIKDKTLSTSERTMYKFTHIKINNKKNEDGDIVHGSAFYDISPKFQRALTESFDHDYKGMRKMAIDSPIVTGNRVLARQFIEYENGDLKEIRQYNWVGKRMHQKSVYLNKELNSVIKYERDQFGRLNSINDTEYGVHVDGTIYHKKVSEVKVERSLNERDFYYKTVSEKTYLTATDKNPTIKTTFNNYGEPAVTTKYRADGTVLSKKYHKRISETHYLSRSGKVIAKDHSDGLKLFASRGGTIDIVKANRGTSTGIGNSTPDSVIALMSAISSREIFDVVVTHLEENGQVPHHALLEYGRRLS